jgi:hypothetical protein
MAIAATGLVSACGGGDDLCTGPFCVTVGPAQPDRLEMGSGDGQTGAPGRELPLPVEVVVSDSAGRPVPDVVVTFGVDEGGGSLSSPSARSDIEGHARVSWTLGSEAGAQSLQVSASRTTGTPLTGSPLTFTAQAVRPPAARLVIQLAPPSVARSGVVFEQQPIVQVLDADDQPVTQVSVAASVASGGGTIGGSTVVSTDAAGLASYSDLLIRGAVGPQILRFSVEPGVDVSSEELALVAGPPASIAGIAPLTYAARVESPVDPAPSVVVKDADGNGTPGVVVSFTASADGSVAPETVTTNEDGIAQVTSWTLGTSTGAQYALTAALQSSSLDPVTFTAATSTETIGGLRITVPPSSPTQAGVAFVVQPVIQVTDRAGNPAARGNVRVAATVASGPGGTLQHASATTNPSGKATFSGLILTGTAGEYTLSFSATNRAGVTSGPIALIAGPPTQLGLASEAPSVRSRIPLSPQPSVQVQDAAGNPVAQAGVEIVASMTGDGTLGGQTTAITGPDGRATYSDLTVTGAPGPRTLTFASTTPALQNVSLPVSLPAVATIAVQTLPSAPVVGQQVSNTPIWILSDADGQPVADVPVTLVATAGVVSPASTTSDGNGVVQVLSWTLGTTAGSQSVTLQAPGGVSPSRVTINVQPDVPATLLKVSGDNQSGTVNSELDSLLVVQVRDQYGNGVSGITVQWRGCDGTGSYDPITDAQGLSSARQLTGPTPGMFCSTASITASVVAVAVFNYEVTAAAPSPDESPTSETLTSEMGGPAPVAPKPR